jgi:hypothetical protein
MTNRRNVMQTIFLLGGFLIGIIITILFQWISQISTDTKVRWESCQPKNVTYGDKSQHFCIQVRERERGWGIRHSQELVITANNIRGVIITDDLIVPDEIVSTPKPTAKWTNEGIAFTNTYGVRIFVPAKIFVEGR